MPREHSLFGDLLQIGGGDVDIAAERLNAFADFANGVQSGNAVPRAEGLGKAVEVTTTERSIIIPTE